MSSANNYTTILRKKKDVMLQLKKSKENIYDDFREGNFTCILYKNFKKKKKKKITTNELIKKFRKNNLIAAESTMRDSNAELIFFGKRYLPCITG